MKRILLLPLVSMLFACGETEEKALAFESGNPTAFSINENSNFSFFPQVAHNRGRLTFSAENLPSWAQIDTQSGELFGTPSREEDAGLTTEITITASDIEQTVTLGGISIEVIAVNDKPVVTSTQIELTEYKQSYEFPVDVTDEESPFSSLDISASDDSANFDVDVTPEGNVTLNLSDAGEALAKGIEFDLNVSDGENTVRSNIRVNISDSNPLVAQSSYSGDVNIHSNGHIEISFNQPVDFEQLVVQSSSGVCSGDIQLSSDGFETCLGLLKRNQDSDYFTFAFEAVGLGVNLDYQLKVADSLRSLVNTSNSDQISSFYTLSGLMITEVGGAYYYDSQYWFEVYNASRLPINLGDYKLNSRAIHKPSCTTGGCDTYHQYTFQLNELIVQPGQYALVRGQSWYADYSDGDRVLYVDDNGEYFPYWGTRGFVELVYKQENTTTDFVVFGDWSQHGGEPTPVTADAWNGIASPHAPQKDFNGDAYTSSLVRNVGLTDTNSEVDWVQQDINTPGGPNDVTSYADADQDGIPDEAEMEGATYAGLDLYGMGARSGVRDIFIEVDYMESEDEGVIPQEEALQKVVDAFAEQGIAVHFDVGDLYDQTGGLNPAKFDLGGGNQVPFSKGVTFQAQPDDLRADAYEIKHANMDLARLSVFHYMLMANSQNADGTAGSSGLAEMYGNDLIISLGNWNLHSGNDTAKNVLINFQASTIMHELGHNLGLGHGGGDDVNYKPNYVSVMNYMYQLFGLPEIGNNEGDRYYKHRNDWLGTSDCDETMTNDYRDDFRFFKIGYSSESNSINESFINENLGLQVTGSDVVDYNCDGALGFVGSVDINNSESVETLSGYDDWQNINLKFQKSYWGNSHGVMSTSSENDQDDISLAPDVVGNDIGVIVEETPPSKAFFDSIRY